MMVKILDPPAELRKKFVLNKANMLKQLVERDGKHCAKCNSVENLTIDHINPICKGGTNILSNLQILCFNCHTIKDQYLKKTDAKVYRINRKINKLNIQLSETVTDEMREIILARISRLKTKLKEYDANISTVSEF